jgi:hypothetical protein
MLRGALLVGLLVGLSTAQTVRLQHHRHLDLTNALLVNWILITVLLLFLQCRCGGGKPCQHTSGKACFPLVKTQTWENSVAGSTAVCPAETTHCNCDCDGATPCRSTDTYVCFVNPVLSRLLIDAVILGALLQPPCLRQKYARTVRQSAACTHPRLLLLRTQHPPQLLFLTPEVKQSANAQVIARVSTTMEQHVQHYHRTETARLTSPSVLVGAPIRRIRASITR